MKLGAIEAGGTKFVCAIGDEKGEVFEKTVIPTETPEITMPKVYEFFDNTGIEKVGIGSFGPIDLNEGTGTYGTIQKTPKTDWIAFPLADEVSKHTGVPVVVDTDVNVAALSESRWGNATDVNSCLYITVGTGIGAGAIVNGETLKGLSHPEMGHIAVRRHEKDTFAGTCPYHGDCLEGMAAGPAIEQRWGKPGKDLADDELVWEIESYYLAQAIVNYIYILSPDRVIMGGGVMQQYHLFDLIRSHVVDMLNGYVSSPLLTPDRIDNYIVPPGLTNEAGIKGSLILAAK
ncbi:fructokinase [Thalassobacillus devorans]|uniref:fructokinase n=1 Tax=Thalassobacillus devorans TaxID=279813 RepID=A0ABQ1NQT3_9BACI|nr:ROK family protein [Thalassobacillus devorans]NIK28844.1 fructokinase [Thalassobacillus devorans]GGC83121.1 fructokinase [Thalassobacillus devorans]